MKIISLYITFLGVNQRVSHQSFSGNWWDINQKGRKRQWECWMVERYLYFLWSKSVNIHIFFFLKNLFIYFNWRPIALKYCSGFCHTLTWISHGCTGVTYPSFTFLLSLFYLFCGIPVTNLLPYLTWLNKMHKISVRDYNNQLYSCHYYKARQKKKKSKDLVSISSSSELEMCPSSSQATLLRFSFVFCWNRGNHACLRASSWELKQ